MEETLNKIKDFYLSQAKKIISVVVLLFLLFSSLYVYNNYVNETEAKISYQLQPLYNKIFQIRDKRESSLAATDDWEKTKEKLQEIYQANPNRLNGVRAYFLKGQMILEEDKFEEAKKIFNTIYEKHRKHYLAPQALVYLGIILENQKKYDETIQKLNQFEKYYPLNFLKGEALIILARNYRLAGKYPESAAILEKIIVDENLLVYQKRAQEDLDMMLILGNIKKPVGSPGVETELKLSP